MVAIAWALEFLFRGSLRAISRLPDAPVGWDEASSRDDDIWEEVGFRLGGMTDGGGMAPGASLSV